MTVTVANPIIAAALARTMTELPAGTPPDDGELGYGHDLACVSDCSDDFAELGPDDPRIILQAIARRYQTPRGGLLDDEEYGFDLRGALHAGMTQRDLRQLQSKAVNEAMKDERVETVTLRLTYAGGEVHGHLHVTPRDPRRAPFAGVLRITDQTVEVVT